MFELELRQLACLSTRRERERGLHVHPKKHVFIQVKITLFGYLEVHIRVSWTD